MMSEKTPIDILITQVSKLTDSVDKLVNMDAARKEREKFQEKENEKVAKFMIENSEPLARLKRSHLRFDKWGTSLGLIVIIALMTMLGFNFTQ